MVFQNCLVLLNIPGAKIYDMNGKESGYLLHITLLIRVLL